MLAETITQPIFKLFWEKTPSHPAPIFRFELRSVSESVIPHQFGDVSRKIPHTRIVIGHNIENHINNKLWLLSSNIKYE